jgi:hypothetical protein
LRRCGKSQRKASGADEGSRHPRAPGLDPGRVAQRRPDELGSDCVATMRDKDGHGGLLPEQVATRTSLGVGVMVVPVLMAGHAGGACDGSGPVGVVASGATLVAWVSMGTQGGHGVVACRARGAPETVRFVAGLALAVVRAPAFDRRRDVSVTCRAPVPPCSRGLVRWMAL